MKTFYAVQHGSNFDWDTGSANKREAVKMANAMKRDHEYDGEEIRIAVIDTKYSVCDDEIVIREGSRD